MFDYFSWEIVGLYIAYSIFAAQQKFCVRDFRGSNQLYRLALGYFAFLTMVFGLGFLIYFGLKTAWWTPFILFVGGLLAYLPFTFLIETFTERFIHLQVWGAASFLAIPIIAYLLLKLTPI